MNFEDFGLDDRLLEGLHWMGFEEATPVQEKVIPAILDDKDLIVSAQTGTGKTAAYLLPVIQKISEDATHKTNTLVIAPTRELAKQIDQQLEGFSYFLPVNSFPIYGGGSGEDFVSQQKALTHGADIIIATPGKLISHMNNKYADFSHLKHLILDEADRMLDMGFYEDIIRIINQLPKNRQTLLFSATMPPKIRQLAKRILNNPEEINIAISKPAEGIHQTAYLAFDDQKINLVKHILKELNRDKVIIFSSTKANVRNLTKELKRQNLDATWISSDLEQEEREEVLRKFKSGKIRVLVATDMISRGIDIENIDLVINYECPADAEDYVHRIGRTARAKSTGEAITLISDHYKEQRNFSAIESLIGYEVEKSPLPESLGKGPDYSPVRKSRKSGGKKKKFFGGKGKKRNN